MEQANKSIDIRLATQKDISVLVDLWISLANEQRSYGSHILADENRYEIENTLLAHLQNDGILVAIDTETIIGFSTFSVEEGYFTISTQRGVISNLYVRPDYRNQGIGSQLLEATEATLFERGVETSMLEVMAENKRAHQFYNRHGYKPARKTLTRSLGNPDKNDKPSKPGE